MDRKGHCAYPIFDPPRRRLVYAILIVALVAISLPLRLAADRFPPFLVLYAGDALWALMLFLLMGAIFPRWPGWRLWAVTLGVCIVVECSQLVQADWLNAIRHFRIAGFPIGGIILGYGFLWTDLVAYTVGVTGGFLGESLVRRLRLAPLS